MRPRLAVGRMSSRTRLQVVEEWPRVAPLAQRGLTDAPAHCRTAIRLEVRYGFLRARRAGRIRTAGTWDPSNGDGSDEYRGGCKRCLPKQRGTDSRAADTEEAVGVHSAPLSELVSSLLTNSALLLATPHLFVGVRRGRSRGPLVARYCDTQ